MQRTEAVKPQEIVQALCVDIVRVSCTLAVWLAAPELGRHGQCHQVAYVTLILVYLDVVAEVLTGVSSMIFEVTQALR